MTKPPPAHPKIYHIVHVDRLASIVSDGQLLSDATMVNRANTGTTIGLSGIKQRRLNSPLSCRPGVTVGGCVPFYFCPRSVMLFLIHCANHPELTYLGGQEPIIHIEADLHAAVAWAERNGKQWAFTLSNGGSFYFEDRCNLGQLHEINWNAVNATRWAGPGISPNLKEGKQAEFLVEDFFPWNLIERIGVYSGTIARQVTIAAGVSTHRVRIEVKREWY